MMNTVDICFVSVLGLTALVGVARGFLREFASVLAWVLACVAVFWVGPFVCAFVRSHVDSAFVADILSSVSLFFLVLVLVSLINTLCVGMTRGVLISPVDRLLGCVLGVLKGCVVLACIDLVSSCFVAREEIGLMQESALAPYVYHMSGALRAILPTKVQILLDDLARRNSAMSFGSGVAAAQGQKPEAGSAEEEAMLKHFGSLSPKASEGADANYTPAQQGQLDKIVSNQSARSA